MSSETMFLFPTIVTDGDTMKCDWQDLVRLLL